MITKPSGHWNLLQTQESVEHFQVIADIGSQKEFHLTGKDIAMHLQASSPEEASEWVSKLSRYVHSEDIFHFTIHQLTILE